MLEVQPRGGADFLARSCLLGTVPWAEASASGEQAVAPLPWLKQPTARIGGMSSPFGKASMDRLGPQTTP